MATGSEGDVVTVKECVKTLFAENGGHKRVMVKLDVRQTRAYGFTDESSDYNISFARVAMLTSETATAAVRYLAQLAGGSFRPLVIRDGNPLALISDAVQSQSKVISGALAAMADGKITPEEAAGVVKLIDESLNDLASLRRSLATSTDKVVQIRQ